MKEILHLHWCYLRGPEMLRDLTKGFALCGLSDVPRKQLTVHKDDATCKKCRKATKEKV